MQQGKNGGQKSGFILHKKDTEMMPMHHRYKFETNKQINWKNRKSEDRFKGFSQLIKKKKVV